MTETSTHLSPQGLYFQIVCDPGHERTIRELSELPKESRERVWADMTGIHLDSGDSSQRSVPYSINSVEHDHQKHEWKHPVWVEKQLEKLDNEIHHLPRTESLQLALDTPMGRDLELRLAFLRTCDFETTQAAQLFNRHFDQKLSLFGKSKMGLPIRLSDLSEDDLESLKCGAIQFLPKTDRGGRPVLISRYRNFVYKKPENMVCIHSILLYFFAARFSCLMCIFHTSSLSTLSSIAASGIVVHAHVSCRHTKSRGIWIGYSGLRDWRLCACRLWIDSTALSPRSKPAYSSSRKSFLLQ